MVTSLLRPYVLAIARMRDSLGLWLTPAPLAQSAQLGSFRVILEHYS